MLSLHRFIHKRTSAINGCKDRPRVHDLILTIGEDPFLRQQSIHPCCPSGLYSEIIKHAWEGGVNLTHHTMYSCTSITISPPTAGSNFAL